ncbi:SusC/RagA family TonB-linked outer membrane protein [Pseudoflavitalea sp. G-6-1-2]|uniref:SusC/RagA family TonB-linked outer membrane protein n=1 Tax=Pseudoflavitalea sp. G-6-1-2 TaxID=2728841 RepID=UPI00146F9022|nr:SusC/RagA family TonB-linked outer membrane protein [Pseudoflavitalea sp. G-6-1-2]NML23002.1 SusC/RagA family TonB-linked outer membrane protein [Pseudoflavitalea sp. G-6-1-2]
MRTILSLTYILLFTIQSSAFVFFQGITIVAKNESLEKVLLDIQKQSDYVMVYAGQQMQVANKVSVSLKNVSVHEAMKEIMKDQPLGYLLEDGAKRIIIQSRRLTQKKIELPEFQRNGSPIKLVGKVLNEKGEPVIGATVRVKGKDIYTSTSQDGSFSFDGIDEKSVIEITSIGYEMKTVSIGGRNSIDIKLNAVAQQMKEVIVSTGYQDIPKERATGSFAKVDNALLNEQVGTNILKRLEGVTSGVLFDNKSNEAGRKKLGLSIRGVSSINGPLDPLIVLDGYIYDGDINNINPNIVESITVLKDAAATSIWGARAGNGVIVITSKKGKFNKKPEVSFNSTFIFGTKPNLFDLSRISSSDFVEVEQTLFNNRYFNRLISRFPLFEWTPAIELFIKRRNGQISSADSLEQINKIKNYDSRNDFMKHSYTNSKVQQYSLGVTGGTSENAYSMIVGYDKSIGELYEKSKKINIRIENTYRPSKNISINLGVAYTNSNQQGGRPSYGTTRVQGRTIPYLKLADENGTALPIPLYRQKVVDQIGGGQLLDWNNYLLDNYKYSKLESNREEWFATAGLQFKINNVLSFDIKSQYFIQNTITKDINDAESFFARDIINMYSQIDPNSGNIIRPVPLGGIMKQLSAKDHSYTIRGQLNFNKSWKNHQVYGILGSEMRELKNESDGQLYYGYNNDPLSVSRIDNVNLYPLIVGGQVLTIPSPPEPGLNVNRYNSVFTNIAYTYDSKYTFSLSARRDGANIFGANTNDKWKPLWSTGFSWNISGEKFYKSSFVPELALRITYGKSGNVDPSKTSKPIMGYSTDPINNNTVAVISSLNDPSLRWEQIAMLNLGIDFSLAKGVVSGTVEYYRKKGTDLYGSVEYDYTTWGGSNFVTKNVADIKGHGIDIVLNSKNINRDIKWNTNLIFNYNLTKTLNYPNPNYSLTTLLANGSSITPVEGKPLYSIAAYKWGKLDAAGSAQGFVDGKLSKDYEAIRNEASLKGDKGNLVFVGSTLPLFNGSLNNHFSWKGIFVAINISYKFGYYFKNLATTYSALVSTGIGYGDFAQRWKQPGDEMHTDVPKFDYSEYQSLGSFYSNAEINVHKADNIRLQYINLGYNFAPLLKRKYVNSLELYFNASNLGIIWKANKVGVDPDYPAVLSPRKTYAFGVRANF